MDANGSIRVVMLPWLAHGHISPFLELARKLAERNFHIYLCSTPINLSSIKKSINKKHSLSIKLVEFHLPTLPDLPPHHHTTNGLPSHLMPTLKKAFELASPNFSTIVKTITPDLVIYDFNNPWAATIASASNIPAVEFITTGATMVSFALHRLEKPSSEFPFQEIQLKGFHGKQFRCLLESSMKEVGDKDRVLEAMKVSCNLILFNTFRELEGKYIDFLSVLMEKKIVPAGPLVHDTVHDSDEGSEIIQWLAKKDESSTVFVSFGSEYFLSKEEMEEVAHGLELVSNLINFIWVVRFPVGKKVKVEEAVPKGFIERIGERGLVVEGWAPQAKILAHSNTGGFVSHCGWNSILESLKFGVPIVAMPMHLDQPLNARLVEEVGVALEVKRGEDGRLNRDEIAQVIRKVMKEKDGEAIRIKAREFSETISMKGEEQIDGVVKELVQLRREWKVDGKYE